MRLGLISLMSLSTISGAIPTLFAISDEVIESLKLVISANLIKDESFNLSSSETSTLNSIIPLVPANAL